MDWQFLAGTLSEATAKSYRCGTHRLVEPEETVARLKPLCAAMGITRVANVTGLDRIGIPVVMVCRPNSRQLAVSQGKGLTLAAAKASGLMESVESYHAERIELPLRYCSYADLARNQRVVDVGELVKLKKSIYQPHLPLLWLEGFDLQQQERVWVPYEIVDTNYTLPLPPGAGSFFASSNGLASGNHLLEAINHGICEAIERDAATLFGLAGWENCARAMLDTGTIDDAACLQVLAAIERAGVLVGLWDITSDVGVPVFQCKITEGPDHPQRPWVAVGYGCHPARGVALLRALTEAVQARLTLIAGSRDDMRRSVYQPGIDRRQPALDWSWIDSRYPRRSFLAVPHHEGDTFQSDLNWLLERLRGAGLRRVVVVDLSRAEFGIAVVRVLVPGLEAAMIEPGAVALGARALAVVAERT